MIMYEDIDFYSLSHAKKRQLLNNKRVATADTLLSAIPEGKPAVRIFEKSLEELLLDRLERGRYTTAGLAEEFNVEQQTVRQIINKYRRRGSDDFTNESFKYNLLTDRHGVIRVKDVTGQTFHYTLEKLPYFARLVDPTLGVSLMNFTDRMGEFPRLLENIPGGTATELDETYAVLLADFWGIEPQEVFDYITQFDREYVDTALMPFLIIDSSEEYDYVRARFHQHPEVYKRFRNLDRSIDSVGGDFVNVAERGYAGIEMYQLVCIDLADLRWSAEALDPVLLRKIDEWVDAVIQTLDPEQDMADSRPANEAYGETQVSIDDEVLSALSNEFQSATDVYESLSPLDRSETTVQEVKESLEMLAGLGVITRELKGGIPMYNSESGSVSRESVL